MVEAQLQNMHAIRLLPPQPASSAELDQETQTAVNNLLTVEPSLRMWPMTMSPPPASPSSPAMVSTTKKVTRSRTTKRVRPPSTKVLKSQTTTSKSSKTRKRTCELTPTIYTQPNTSIPCSSTPSNDLLNLSINSPLLPSSGSNTFTCSANAAGTYTTSTSAASISSANVTSTLVGNGCVHDPTFMGQYSQIMFMFSQIFDFVLVPSLTFSSAFGNTLMSSNPFCQSLAAGSAQNDPTILIFLYRQIIFNEFQNSLKEEILVHNPIGSPSASALTVDKLLSIFGSSCRKLGINF